MYMSEIRELDEFFYIIYDFVILLHIIVFHVFYHSATSYMQLVMMVIASVS